MTSRREARTRRETVQRRRARRILIYCGGVRSEPDYLNGLRRQRSGVAVDIMSKGVAPERLVAEAAKYRNYSTQDYAEVWYVTDVDEFDITRACQIAPRQGIELAISNPRFELWLLLHFSDRWTAAHGYKEVAAQLKKHLPEYDKTSLRFEDFSESVAEAAVRAKRLDEHHEKPYANPSTTMWKLVESIMERNNE